MENYESILLKLKEYRIELPMSSSWMRRRVRFGLKLLTSRRAWGSAGRFAGKYFDPARCTPLVAPTISFETTNICNSRCVFCANGVVTRPRMPMDMGVFRTAIAEIAVSFPHSPVNFCAVIGEPLLDPLLLERARCIAAYPGMNRSLGFVTTLQWLHRWNLNEFVGAGFKWISVSTMLAGAQTYREFFGVDLYEQMRANLFRLVEENERRGRPIAIQMSLKPANRPLTEVLAHPDLATVSRLLGTDLASQVRDPGFFVDDWTGAVALPTYLRQRPRWPRLFRPCRLLYETMIVFSNGSVGVCSCRDYNANSALVTGRLGKTTLTDVWTGPKLAKIRSDWRGRNIIPEICRRCTLYAL